MQVGEVATGAGPPNFGPDGTAMGAGFEYPPKEAPAEKQSPKECFRSIFAAEGEGCKADDSDDADADDGADDAAEADDDLNSFDDAE